MENFETLTNEELLDTDGGFVLTTGAIIALCCFGGGCILGGAWALCD